MAQWEMCCAALVSWKSTGITRSLGKLYDAKTVLYYYTPTGVITKFPSINSRGQVNAILSAAEWEAITIQHGLLNVGSDTGWAGSLRGMYVNHPSGDKNPDGSDVWRFDFCNMVAYFKRPMQAGRNIDDAL